jgi:hypothetical protein
MFKFIRLQKDKYWFRLKRYLMNIIQSKKSDKTIAWSYSLGTFVAVFPTPGFSTFIGLALIGLFRQLNKMAVLMAMVVWNAVTVVPVYWFSFKIGQKLAWADETTLFRFEWANNLLQYFKDFIVGNLFITIPISILSYFIALILLKRSRIIRRKRAIHKYKKGLML